MKKVSIVVVAGAPLEEADLAFRRWLREHPQIAARLNDGDVEAAHMCHRETRTATRRYTIAIDEADAALIRVSDEPRK